MKMTGGPDLHLCADRSRQFEMSVRFCYVPCVLLSTHRSYLAKRWNTRLILRGDTFTPTWDATDLHMGASVSKEA